MNEPASTSARTLRTPSPIGELPEFTVRAIAAGVVFGIVFGAANAYLGLRVGLTVAGDQASNPVKA